MAKPHKIHETLLTNCDVNGRLTVFCGGFHTYITHEIKIKIDKIGTEYRLVVIIQYRILGAIIVIFLQSNVKVAGQYSSMKRFLTLFSRKSPMSMG